MTRPSLGSTSKRLQRSGIAHALGGALLLNALPAYAQTPTARPASAPPPSSVPTPSAPPAGAQAPAGAPQPLPSAVSPVDAPAPPEAPTAPAEGEPATTSAEPLTPMPAAAPVAPTSEASASPAGEKPMLPAYLMWGVGGASLIIGGAFGIAALTAESDYKDNPTISKADSVHTRALVADIGLGLGVILVAAGSVFYFVKEPPPEHAQRSRSPVARLGILPVVGLKSQGAAVTLNF